MSVVRVTDIVKQFPGVTAVDRLSFEVLPGELFGLVGSDGAGKTTLLRMLVGALHPTSGTASVLGSNVTNLNAVRASIGYMSQRFGLYPDLTVGENIRFHAAIHGIGTSTWRDRADRLLSMSGLSPFINRRAAALSGGMKQKLGLCCALIHTPTVLFLDEPTNGVDPVSRRDFWRILGQLQNDGVTIVVATAYLDEAERCDRVALVHHGTLLACSTPTLLKEHYGPEGGVAETLEDVVVSLIGQRQEPSPMPPREIPLHGPLALDLVAVTRRFGDFTAVNAISLQVRRGEIFGFLGPNGAGKSTTIKMMCGILSPSEGDGFVGGLSIRTQAEQIKEQIGYMSQRFSLYEDLTVRENIAFYAGIYQLSPDATKTKMEWVLEMADLTDRADSRAGELSAGLRQRLALGCSLLHDPPVVFLDEPTAGVDPLNRRRFWKLIYELAEQGVTIFVTTHYMDEAAYCDRLAMIYHGSLIAVGTPAELQRSHVSNGQIPNLEEVFVRLIEEYDQNQRHQEAVHEH